MLTARSILGLLWSFLFLFVLFPCVQADEQTQLDQALNQKYDALDLRLFQDSIHHWQMKDGRTRNDARYQPEQIVHIAENLLRFQNEDGGWPTNLDWLAQIDPAEIIEIRGGTFGSSTFDNRNTYSQVAYLSQVYQATKLERYRASAERGLHYILQEQRASGGWCGKDVDAITYNDDVMTGVMRLLLQIKNKQPEFDWIKPTLRQDLITALEKGIRVTLHCQIVVEGKKTAWCQQHSHETLEPVNARTFELASICSSESAGIVRFLMELPNPSPEIIEAVDAAVAWLDEVKIEGIRVEQVEIEPVVFKHHTARQDRVVVADPDAPPIWTRYYEIGTNRPFFCNRDGVKVYSLAEVHLERRSGYGWYSTSPWTLISEEYPKWKDHLAAR
ncbi:MAG: pectate lyase [Planctomycetaceae bacterium]